MKTLYLIQQPGTMKMPRTVPDEITLNREQHSDSKMSGKRLAERGVKPEMIIAADTAAAIELANVVAEELDLPRSSVDTTRHIFEAEEAELMEFLRNVDDNVNSLMLAGQRTTFTPLANLLSGQKMAELPAGGVAGLELDIDHWKEADEGCGRVTFRIDPDDYPPATNSQDLVDGNPS